MADNGWHICTGGLECVVALTHNRYNPARDFKWSLRSKSTPIVLDVKGLIRGFRVEWG